MAFEAHVGGARAERRAEAKAAAPTQRPTDFVRRLVQELEGCLLHLDDPCAVALRLRDLLKTAATHLDAPIVEPSREQPADASAAKGDPEASVAACAKSPGAADAAAGGGTAEGPREEGQSPRGQRLQSTATQSDVDGRLFQEALDLWERAGERRGEAFYSFDGPEGEAPAPGRPAGSAPASTQTGGRSGPGPTAARAKQPALSLRAADAGPAGASPQASPVKEVGASVAGMSVEEILTRHRVATAEAVTTAPLTARPLGAREGTLDRWRQALHTQRVLDVRDAAVEALAAPLRQSVPVRSMHAAPAAKRSEEPGQGKTSSELPSVQGPRQEMPAVLVPVKGKMLELQACAPTEPATEEKDPAESAVRATKSESVRVDLFRFASASTGQRCENALGAATQQAATPGRRVLTMDLPGGGIPMRIGTLDGRAQREEARAKASAATAARQAPRGGAARGAAEESTGTKGSTLGLSAEAGTRCSEQSWSEARGGSTRTPSQARQEPAGAVALARQPSNGAPSPRQAAAQVDPSAVRSAFHCTDMESVDKCSPKGRSVPGDNGELREQVEPSRAMSTSPIGPPNKFTARVRNGLAEHRLQLASKEVELPLPHARSPRSLEALDMSITKVPSQLGEDTQNQVRVQPVGDLPTIRLAERPSPPENGGEPARVAHRRHRALMAMPSHATKYASSGG